MRLSANVDVSVWDISYFLFSWATFDATKCVKIPRKLNRHQFTCFSFLLDFFFAVAMDSVAIQMSSTAGIFTTIFLSSVFGYFYYLRSRKEVKLPLVPLDEQSSIWEVCVVLKCRKTFFFFFFSLFFCAMHILPFHSHVTRIQCWCVFFVLKSLLSSGTRLLLARSMLLLQAIKLHRRTWHFNLESFNTSHHRFAQSKQITNLTCSRISFSLHTVHVTLEKIYF